VRDAEHELFGSELATMRETYEEVRAILQQGLARVALSHHGASASITTMTRCILKWCRSPSALLVCGNRNARPSRG
jgi:hypothetical protein